MPIQFFDSETSFIDSPAKHLEFKGQVSAQLKAAARKIPSADEITGIEIRLLPPYIIDNNTEPFLLFKGFAKLYCITIVVSDVNNQLVGGIDIKDFPRIGDKEYLPVNKTIFYWQQDDVNVKPPSQIHTMVSIIKSKAGLRKFGDIMADLKNDDDYKGITKSLASTAKNATAAGVAIDVVTQLASIVGRHLGKVEDKPIGTVINSFTALHGDFDNIGIMKKLYPTKKVNFELELIVRDDSVKTEQQATKGMKGIKGKRAAKTVRKEEVVVDMTPII